MHKKEHSFFDKFEKNCESGRRGKVCICFKEAWSALCVGIEWLESKA